MGCRVRRCGELFALALVLAAAPATLEQEPISAPLSLARPARLDLGYVVERVSSSHGTVQVDPNGDVQGVIGERPVRVAFAAASGSGVLTRAFEVFDAAGASLAKGAMSLEVEAAQDGMRVTSMRIDRLEGTLGKLSRPAVLASKEVPLTWRPAARLTGTLERAAGSLEGELVLAPPLSPDAFLSTESGAPLGVTLYGAGELVTGVAKVTREGGAIVWALDERAKIEWREEDGAWRGRVTVAARAAVRRAVIRLGDGRSALSVQASLPATERDRS